MLEIKKVDSKNNLNEFIITVPDNVQFIEDWGSDFHYLSNIMAVDKVLCGCGFTRWALNNNTPTILLSPRRVLLENKEDQHNSKKHPDLRPVYYFRNGEEDQEKAVEFDKELDATVLSLIRKEMEEETRILSKEEVQQREYQKEENRKKRQEFVKNLKLCLLNYLNYGFSEEDSKGWDFVPKILVTYDSFHYVLEVLGERIKNFTVVVDEYQCMFQDSTFKSEVELNTLELLKSSVPNICFVSATPMIDKYLEKVEFFRNVPIYRLDWGSRITSVNIQRIYTPSLSRSIKGEIEKYRSGKGTPIKIERDEETGEVKIYESHEAVFFVNSVTLICDVIRSAQLMPEEVNILCSDTGINNSRLKKLGKRVSANLGIKKKEDQLVYEIGKLPDEGDPHKMFTFCTRTVYLGADFYSTNAMTYLCGDLNVETLVVDISLDLPQIVGRQRLMENKFRDEVIYFFKSKNKKKNEITEGEFNRHLTKKVNDSEEILSGLGNLSNVQYSLMVDILHQNVSAYGYKKNFVGVVRQPDGGFGAVMNELVLVSEMRAFEIARPEYQENIVISAERDKISSGNSYNVRDLGSEEQNLAIFKEFTRKFKAETFTANQLKVFCDFIKDHPDIYLYYRRNLSFIPLSLRNYMNYLGPHRISALKYQEADILREIYSIKNSSALDDRILTEFNVGENYPKKFIKDKLVSIYEELGITGKPKANDLEKYFELCDTRFPLSNGERIPSFKILSRK